jgi:glycerol-3-phosphate dehydrogenase subunit C
MGTLDFRAAEFWEPHKADQELRRVYDICAGCRRCPPLCPSFKVLFDQLDVDAVDGDVEKLPAADVKEVVDLCYQCKLCYNYCPYTPPHRREVDFPRLMLRARAAQTRASGVSLQDRVLGNTELVGKLGSLTAPPSNWMNEVSVHGAFMQAVLGIHKDRNLTRFQPPTFSTWFRRRPRAPAPARTVALFATCQVEYHQPAVGRAAVRVLEKNGVAVTLPTQRCCGMPYLDGGAVDEARALVRDNVRSLAEWARQGCDILIQGSDGRTQRRTTSAGAPSPTTRTASPPARAARSRRVSDTCSSCRRGNRIVVQSGHGLHSRTRSINAAKNGGKHGRN